MAVREGEKGRRGRGGTSRRRHSPYARPPSQWRAAVAGGVCRDLTSGTCHRRPEPVSQAQERGTAFRTSGGRYRWEAGSRLARGSVGGGSRRGARRHRPQPGRPCLRAEGTRGAAQGQPPAGLGGPEGAGRGLVLLMAWLSLSRLFSLCFAVLYVTAAFR